jgi:hypothetical protein
MSGRARVLLAVVGVALVVAAIWALVHPIQATKTTTERTPPTATTATTVASRTSSDTTTASAAVVTTTVASSTAPSAAVPLEVSKRTIEISESRPDTLIAAVAALGIVLLATAGFPGLKFGLGGASAEVLVKETADTTKAQIDRLQLQVDNVQQQLRVAVSTLLAEIEAERPNEDS